MVHYCPSLSFLSPLLLNLAYLFYHISYRKIGVCLYWNSALLFVRSGIVENLDERDPEIIFYTKKLRA